MLLLNLILLIDVTFSTPTPDYISCYFLLECTAHDKFVRMSRSDSPSRTTAAGVGVWVRINYRLAVWQLTSG